MTKLLVDDLDRIVGKTEDAWRGGHNIVEYGRRDGEGILYVVGRARLTNISECDMTPEAFQDLPEYRL